MHFRFVLELPDIDLWNIDLLDIHLDLLDTDIPSFVCLHSVFKTSSRYVFKTSSRHVFKTSSRHVFKTPSRRLQRNNFSSSETSSRRVPRYLQDVLEDVKLLRWRRVEDVFKTNKCLLRSDELIHELIKRFWEAEEGWNDSDREVLMSQWECFGGYQYTALG